MGKISFWSAEEKRHVRRPNAKNSMARKIPGQDLLSSILAWKTHEQTLDFWIVFSSDRRHYERPDVHKKYKKCQIANNGAQQISIHAR